MKTSILISAIFILFESLSNSALGQNWEWQNPLPTSTSLTNVQFVNDSTGWIIGFAETILRTDDGGQNWSSQSEIGTGYFQGLAFLNRNLGWISGASGTIFHTSTGGTTWIEEPPQRSIPQSFTMHPNYPNPFNSSTTISYSLPKSGNIDLKVFDLQGREVRSLYQGFQRAGNYKLNFEGKNLSSGTYFVRMKAGESVRTQKVVLLK